MRFRDILMTAATQARGGYAFAFTGSALPGGASLTRASTGWYFDSSGVLQSAAADEARFTATGLLVEPARTNVMRNNTMVGTVAGTPGTAPTNLTFSSTGSGITREIVGTGTEDGIEYIDVKYSGTPSATSNLFLGTEASTQVPALAGQTWETASYTKLVAGSLTNTTIVVRLVERNGAGTFLVNGTTTVVPTAAALRTQRYSTSRTLTEATTAYVTGYVSASHTSGLAIDFTLRIGLPQFEQAEDVSSPIKTTGAAITRAADVLSLALPDATYDIDIIRESGVTNITGAVVSGGAYTVPTDLSPLQSVIARRVS